MKFTGVQHTVYLLAEARETHVGGGQFTLNMLSFIGRDSCASLR